VSRVHYFRNPLAPLTLTLGADVISIFLHARLFDAELLFQEGIQRVVSDDENNRVESRAQVHVLDRDGEYNSGYAQKEDDSTNKINPHFYIIGEEITGARR